MTLRISDPKVDELAQKLSEQTGEDPTAAVIRALEEKLQLKKPTVEELARPSQDNQLNEKEIAARAAAVLEIVTRIKRMPVLDHRSPDEMLYDENGLPS